MKDQGEQSHETFLVKNFFFLDGLRRPTGLASHSLGSSRHRSSATIRCALISNCFEYRWRIFNASSRNGKVQYYFEVGFNFWIYW